MEHQSRALEDRKILEEALQRGKEEALLLAKARDMRARLIEQMQVMARSKSLQATLCAWRHFCNKSRRKRVRFLSHAWPLANLFRNLSFLSPMNVNDKSSTSTTFFKSMRYLLTDETNV